MSTKAPSLPSSVTKKLPAGRALTSRGARPAGLVRL